MNEEEFNDIKRQAKQRKEKPMSNQPAFPCDLTMYDKEVANAMQGMALRDYFAAKAMQGMMVDVEQPRCDYIARTAYEMADAMVKAREA